MNAVAVTFAVIAVVVVATADTAATPWEREIVLNEALGVRMRWNMSATVITLQFEAAVNGYVSVGWSKEGKMANSFAAFGSDRGVNSSISELVITTSTGSGVGRAPDQPLQNATVVSANGITTLTFSRPIQHPTRPVPIDQDTHMIWAVHNTAKKFALHTAMGSFIVNLSNGVARPRIRWILILHAALMFAAFAIAFPLGVLWARFRAKSNPDRIARHRQLQMAAAVLALAGFIVVIVDIGPDDDHFDSLHSVAGLVVMIGTALQLSLAFLRPEFGSAWRTAWTLFHLYVGRVLIVAGPVVCALGAVEYSETVGPELRWLLGLIIAMTAAIWTAAVVLLVRERRQQQQEQTQQHTQHQGAAVVYAPGARPQ